MMTVTKVRKALDKLDRRLAGKASGRPMSGLSIPADYYLAGSRKAGAPTAGGRKRVKAAPAK